MSALGATVDVFDWSVDLLRALVRLEPRPPSGALVFEKHPKVRELTTLKVETRRTFYGFFLVEQDGTVLFEGPVPPEGRVTVMPMTPAQLRLRLSLEGRNPLARHATTVIETVFDPLPNGPAVEQFVAPASVAEGGNIPIGWAAPTAEEVRVAVIDDNEVTEHIGPATGQWVARAPRAGHTVLWLTAQSSWGETTVTRSVKVIAARTPQLSLISLRPTVQTGLPGDTVRFEWQMSEAESAWLVAPDAAAPRPLKDKSGGILEVTLGLQPVEFEVIARGAKSAERRLFLRAVPDPLAALYNRS